MTRGRETDIRATREEPLDQKDSDPLEGRKWQTTRDGSGTHSDRGELDETEKPGAAPQKDFDDTTGRTSPKISQTERQPERGIKPRDRSWPEYHVRSELEVNRATKILRPNERWNQVESPGERRSIEKQEGAQEEERRTNGRKESCLLVISIYWHSYFICTI